MATTVNGDAAIPSARTIADRCAQEDAAVHRAAYSVELLPLLLARALLHARDSGRRHDNGNDSAVQCLRAIGNLVADSEPHRAELLRILESRADAVPPEFEADTNLHKLWISVLINLCIDCDLASIYLRDSAHVVDHIIKTFSKAQARPCHETLPHQVMLHLWATVAAPLPPPLVDPSAAETLASLARAHVACLPDGAVDTPAITHILDILLACSASGGDFCALIERFGVADLLWAAMANAPFEENFMESCTRILVTMSHCNRVADLWISKPAFVKSLLVRLSADSPSKQPDRHQKSLLACACLLLGNIGRSPENCKRLIFEFRAEDALLATIQTYRQAEILTPSLAAFFHLCISESERAHLGQSLLSLGPQVVSDILSLANQNITRLLLGILRMLALPAECAKVMVLGQGQETNPDSIHSGILATVMNMYYMLDSPDAVTTSCVGRFQGALVHSCLKSTESAGLIRKIGESNNVNAFRVQWDILETEIGDSSGRMYTDALAILSVALAHGELDGNIFGGPRNPEKAAANVLCSTSVAEADKLSLLDMIAKNIGKTKDELQGLYSKFLLAPESKTMPAAIRHHLAAMLTIPGEQPQRQ